MKRAKHILFLSSLAFVRTAKNEILRGLRKTINRILLIMTLIAALMGLLIVMVFGLAVAVIAK